MKKSSYIIVWQPLDADQFDASTMRIVDCLTMNGDRDEAYRAANEKLSTYLTAHGAGKLSVWKGDLTTQSFSTAA